MRLAFYHNPLVYRDGHGIARPLTALADQVGALAAFDFVRPVGVQSKIAEVRDLSRVMGSMSRTIHNFQADHPDPEPRNAPGRKPPA